VSAVGRTLRETPAQVGPLASNLTWTRPPDGRWTPPARTRIVGVVRDIRNVALGIAVEPAVYAPMRQFPFRSVTIAVAARDRATAVEAVRQALKAVAPNTPLGLVEAWPERLRSRTAEPRLLMSTLTAFGMLAAFLAALGVYGLFSWSVALRQRELAIRVALGARPAAVGGDVIRRSAVLVAVGLVLGLGLVQASRGLLETVLFGVTPHDLVSLAAGGAVLFAAAVASSLPPAWRAMQVDPVQGLRAE
jgi:ABC-type antimicrobial peptide transport system permease subunit